MAYTTLADVPAKVEACLPFKGNSLYAEYEGGVYVVYSYGPHHPLAIKDPDAGWIVNESRRSVTTSRHRTVVLRGIKGGTMSVDTQTAIGIVRAGGYLHHVAKRLGATPVEDTGSNPIAG